MTHGSGAGMTRILLYTAAIVLLMERGVGSWFPTLSAERSGKDGARGFVGESKTANDPAPTFDVAVIRLNPGDSTGHSHIWSSPSDWHFKAQNVTALALIQFAFAMPETRIVGGPRWMHSTNSTWRPRRIRR
jgi:hypothetical protein